MPKKEVQVEGQEIAARAIVEVLGAPKDYVENTLKMLLSKLKETKGIRLVDGKVFKPKPQGQFFSTFAEIELVFDDISLIPVFCFDYMPSSFEIVEPEELKFPSRHISDFTNDLMARLHQTDAYAKKLNAENQVLIKNTVAVFKNFIVYCLKDSEKTLSQLSEAVGIKPEELEPFLKDYVKIKLIGQKGNKYYSLVKKDGTQKKG